MIKRIHKLKTKTTEEQVSQQWGEVLSHRNKLLSNSDWTQLPDSGLTLECVEQWRRWRAQLKNITRANFGDLAAAEGHINNLAKRAPFNTYNAEVSEPMDYESIDEYRASVIDYLNKTFNNKINGPFLDNPLLVDEQFNEAVDYSKNPNKTYPLINSTALELGLPEKDIVADFIERKAQSVKRMVSLKKKYYYFHKLALDADSDVKLSELLGEVIEWTLTST